jgi:hypothetical protein
MPPESASATTAPATERVDADVHAVLVDLAITVQKHGMYPREHPLLRTQAERLSSRLQALLAQRGSLALAVGLDSLLVDGLSSECDIPIVRDVARRLRDHQIGAVTFFQGVAWHEIERFFTALAADPAARAAIDAAPFGPNLHVRAAGYDLLAIGDADSRDLDGPTPEELWKDLAQAVLGEVTDADARAVVRALDQAGRDEQRRQQIAGCLVRLLEGLAKQTGHGREHPVGHRLADLFRQVRPETLRNLLWLEGDAAARARLLRMAATVFSGDALTLLIRAAAEASKRETSATVLRVLGKISAQTGASDLVAARLANAELQSGIERLLADWHLADPNPEPHNALLDEAAFGSAEAMGSSDLPRVGVDERLLRICMDLGVWGEGAARAVERLLDAGEALLLLGLLQEAGKTIVGEELARRVLVPRTLRVLTAGADVDGGVLTRAARAMGPAAIAPLLEALVDSRSRAMRRTLFDILVTLGPGVAEAALERIEDERWYVRRNMLALIERAGRVPDSLPIRRLVGDPDSRVRIQAIAIAAGHPDGHAAFTAALGDEEPRVVVAALRNMTGTLPASFVEPLRRIATGHAADMTRTLATRALGRIRDVEACRALIGIASPGRSWLGRVRIRHDQAAAEAVRVLAASWSGFKDAKPVIKAAARTTDGGFEPPVETRP